MSKKMQWFGLSALVVLVDQLSKWFIVKYLVLNDQLAIFPFFNIVYVRNYGAAFSFLDNAGGLQRWFFAAISLFVCIGLIIWLLRLPAETSPWLKCSLSLLLGGALGNLWDRLTTGYVVDFLDVYVSNYHWPAFNVADSAVCVGTILLIGLLFVKREL